MEHPTHETHEVTETGATHVTPVRTLLIVYVALMVLLFATYGAAQINAGPFNIIIALAIAIIKTTLVVLFFMGVIYNSKLTMVWASLGFIWLLFLFGTMGDYITREWVRLPAGW
jgi:cytochrome c oxidase subunit 4